MPVLNALYAPVIFLAAFLLFLVEPMTTKRLLPALGGSAAVWITCLVFFQCALLTGYLYAHLISSRLRHRTQAAVHSAVLALAVAALLAPVRVAAASWHPLATTLWLLTAMIGLPFAALAATTPLVQSWHARAGNRPGWRYYALSNLGSMLALILYPWIVEPFFALGTQRVVWGFAFAVFAAGCACLAWTSGAKAPLKTERISTYGLKPVPFAADGAEIANPTYLSETAARRRALEESDLSRNPFFDLVRRIAGSEALARTPAPAMRYSLWVLLPAASSMLLCAITGHLSQNIAAIPLLWTVPLAAYLLSFIVTFAGPGWYPRLFALPALVFALAAMGYALYQQTRHGSPPLLISIPFYAGSLFVFCYFCHGEVFRLRPAPEQLTRFYLLLSLGSALGAIIAGVAAPKVFSTNYDLPLSLIFLGLLAAAATWRVGFSVRMVSIAAVAGMAFVAVLQARSLRNDTVSQLRSFYGSLRVTQTYAIPGPGIQRTLFHGTIQHGIQVFNDKLRGRPTSYYAPDSGVGLAIRYCCGDSPRRIGVVGLGVGTVAAYGRPGDSITFYEIDPLVERLARARFAYLHESRAQVNVVLGDARISLENEPGQNFDVLVLDAFSGDAVPVHLLTAQAIALYRRHLKPSGILAFHISSQYVDLAPVLAAQAQHAGMMALGVHSLANDELGEFQADWVLMSADRTFFDQPEVAIAARPIALRADLPLWTDDRNSLLPEIKWMGIQAGPENGQQARPVVNR